MINFDRLNSVDVSSFYGYVLIHKGSFLWVHRCVRPEIQDRQIDLPQQKSLLRVYSHQIYTVIHLFISFSMATSS